MKSFKAFLFFNNVILFNFQFMVKLEVDALLTSASNTSRSSSITISSTPSPATDTISGYGIVIQHVNSRRNRHRKSAGPSFTQGTDRVTYTYSHTHSDSHTVSFSNIKY